ncbi:hypothetical protein BC351_08170 [Paenibacillus ferrarius]|uniref:Uncharacterized protein n=1 Tax=Paenibacillus ferrarius TaxID=1469647 RepID=A0A1V4HD13_9BACL|nr:hypothetical protein BC351_08170 [Paenibacillus ferrarius]
MHPFEAISALLDGKAENACIIAGIFIFHPISLKKPALLQALTVGGRCASLAWKPKHPTNVLLKDILSHVR